MKDQKKLLNNCLNEEIPAIVFCGDDSCMVEILKAANKIYKEKGCSPDFLYDFHLLIKDAEEYQRTSSNKVKLPGLTPFEQEQIRKIIQLQ